MKLMFKTMAVLACLVGSFAAAAPASAENLLMRFRVDYPYPVQLGFYSQNYSRAWPGNGNAWDIYDYDTHTFNLRCTPGEKICWGAWDKTNVNTYWGVRQGDRSCTNCCYVCGTGTPNTQVLE